MTFNANKARMGGLAGFLAMLAVPVGAEPNAQMAGLVLLQAALAAFGMGEPVDPALFEAAFNVLWYALGGAVFGFVSVWAIPNRVKNPSPGSDAVSGISGGKPLASLAALAIAASLVATLLAGCANREQPLTPKQQAYELLGHYELAQIAVEKAVTSPLTPPSVKTYLKVASATATDAVLAYVDAVYADESNTSALFLAAQESLGNLIGYLEQHGLISKFEAMQFRSNAPPLAAAG